MFTTVCDFNSKLFRIEITESINIAQNLITNFYLVSFQKIVLPYNANTHRFLCISRALPIISMSLRG